MVIDTEAMVLSSDSIANKLILLFKTLEGGGYWVVEVDYTWGYLDRGTYHMILHIKWYMYGHPVKGNYLN